MPFKIKEFRHGGYGEAMAKLIATGFQPATAKDIMELRLEDRLSWHDYYHTVSGVAYTNNGENFKVLPFSHELTKLCPVADRFNNYKRINEDEYKAIQAEEFTRKELVLMNNHSIPAEEVLQHPVLLTLVEGDKELLEKYTDKDIPEEGPIYGLSCLLSFYPSVNVSALKEPCICPVFIDSIDDFTTKIVGGYAGTIAAHLVGINKNKKVDFNIGFAVNIAEKYLGKKPLKAFGRELKKSNPHPDILNYPIEIENIIEIAQNYLGPKPLNDFRNDLEGASRGA